MAEDNGGKKELIKRIILDLHQGLSVKEAKERFEREVGHVSSSEIAEIEQSLINEGMSPDEIKQFCNVHALLFESALQEEIESEEDPAHPVHLFKEENREVEKLTAQWQDVLDQAGEMDTAATVNRLTELLGQLQNLELHYTRKEQLLFPYLEKHGFMGPTQVMWGKHNEIRDLLKEAGKELESVSSPEDLQTLAHNTLRPLAEEVDGMIFKEENILFPTALEKLKPQEWVEILKEGQELGYAFITPPRETSQLIEHLEQYVTEEAVWREGEVVFPSGQLNLDQLMAIFNSLPVEITFVDHEDRVRYFNEGRQRIFFRPRSVLGRHVQNCHPPQSVDLVEQILSEFKQGTRDTAEFWLQVKGQFVFIEFVAVRDEAGRYLGTLETVQDAGRLRELKGEKRLLDEAGEQK